jgi:hypothetical protein
MEGFGYILDWELQQGSHSFPGEDGGTCINEAAIVAAGFEYRAIRAVEQMPDCFSRPICRLAMQLNDEATDAQRQCLIPFVMRLACADVPEVEQKRADYIARRTFFRRPFATGLDVLEGALAIGRQADFVAPDEAKTRMQAVRATAATSAPDRPIFAKLKSWFAIRKDLETVS